MARKTDGEKVDELLILTAVLKERVEDVEEELTELKDDLKEARRRLWLIVPPLLAALLTAALTALVNTITRH